MNTSTELATIGPQGLQAQDPLISMIERAARDHSIDIDKLERLLAMAERQKATAAEQAFNDAMNEVQSELDPVRKDASNPQTRSKYATYGSIDAVVRPLYAKLGFSLSFSTEDTPKSETVKVICHVSRGGHTRKYQIDVPADGKGAKGNDVMTKTHAVGSGVTYGRRYLLTMIFNIVTDDDDGNAATRLPKKNARDIYQKLQREMAEQPTVKRLENWARANEPLFLMLPEDWRVEIQERYQTCLKTVHQVMEKPTELEHDEDGVIWDDPPETDAGQSKWAAMSPVQQAGIRCGQHEFVEFIAQVKHWHAADGTAAEFVRAACNIKSRALLSTDANAAAKWRKLDSEFTAWKLAGTPTSARTAEQPAPSPAVPPDGSQPESGAGDLTVIIEAYDASLASAAKIGMMDLETAWKKIPKEYQPTLKAALDRRHKPNAAEADRAAAS
jgi:ERF superfamily protein